MARHVYRLSVRQLVPDSHESLAQALQEQQNRLRSECRRSAQRFKTVTADNKTQMSHSTVGRKMDSDETHGPDQKGNFNQNRRPKENNISSVIGSELC